MSVRSVVEINRFEAESSRMSRMEVIWVSEVSIQEAAVVFAGARQVYRFEVVY